MVLPDNSSTRRPGVTRFFGGSPLTIIFRLALLSVLIGFMLSVMGLDPRNIIASIETLIRAVWDMGFDALRWVWRYFLLGAVIVFPIWLIMRLFKSAGR